MTRVVCCRFVAGLVLLGGAAVPAQPPRDYGGNCTDADCHIAYTKRAVVHGPVSQGACDGCHEETEGQVHRFTLVEEGAALCAECHDEHEGKVVHQPVADGQCGSCHDPHGSGTKGLLIEDSQRALCESCHDELLEDLDFLHGPVAAGACTACHNPHASDQPKLLLGADRALCVKCHATLAERTEKKRYVHSPVKQGCIACHNPHGAKNKMMLSSGVPELCLECHDEIGELIEDAAVKHTPLTAGRSCATCHDPHGSDVEHVLVQAQMDICLSCHDKEQTTKDGKISDVAAFLRENVVHHGPIAQKECTGCHGPHGGEHFRMLKEAYPAGIYTPFETKRYALCFECHESELVEEETTDEATNFRNGEQNLHFVHVNRAVKGRTCRVCHGAHAGKLPKLLVASVPFGGWQLPINYEQTSTGGGCQPGCHRAYRYDRGKPVSNIPNPNAVNVR